MIGAFLFILIQLVLLVDMAHSLNESWVNRMEEGNSRRWYAGRYLNSTRESRSALFYIEQGVREKSPSIEVYKLSRSSRLFKN